MKKLLLTLMLTVVSSGIVFNTGISLANAQENYSIYGTHAVFFQPTQVGGELQGCTLVYRAVQADHAYLRGDPVVIVGNIGIQQFGEELLLTLKIGVKELGGNRPFVRPHFAYLQTKSHSTAKVKQVKEDGEEGFSLFAYSLYNTDVMGLNEEMMNSGKINIGFNRKEKGLDVQVPIDLEVVDAEYTEDRKVIRKRSKETMLNFAECSETLVKRALSTLDKKTE